MKKLKFRVAIKGGKTYIYTLTAVSRAQGFNVVVASFDSGIESITYLGEATGSDVDGWVEEASNG